MTQTLLIKFNKRFFTVAGLIMTAIGALLFSLVYFGVYNVSALTGHTNLVYQVLDYARVQSIDARIDDNVPELSNFNWQGTAVKHYEQHCVACHGAPGVAPQSFSLGMMPAPSAIVRVARQRTPAELYWVIENGVKMSGMPAWKYRLNKQEIWQLVALIKQLPTLSKSQYAQLRKQQNISQNTSSDMSQSGILSDKQRTNQTLSGKVALQQYNCNSCHVIDGIASAIYHVGPPLNNMVNRHFIAGTLPTSRENLIQWIMKPAHFKPQSLMPDLQVKREHAEAMVDYLYQISDK